MAIKPHPGGPDAAGNPRWLIDWYPRGRRGPGPDGRRPTTGRQRRSFTGTVSQARAWLKSQLVQRSRDSWGIVSSGNFQELVREFLESKTGAGRREGYTREIERVLCRELAGRWAGRDPGTISPRDVEVWLRQREKAGAGPRTRAKELTMLGTFFRWAMKRRHVSANPVDAIDRPRVDARPPRWLTPAEFAALHGAAPEYLKPLLLTLVATGIRAGELCGLRREDLRGDMLYLIHRKARDWNALKVAPALRKLLLEQPERKDGLVFTRPTIYQGQVARDDRWTISALNRAVKTAAGRADLQKVTTHVLRHTTASWMVMAGQPIYTVKSQLGHATVATTERYAHLAQSSWAEASGALPAVATSCLPWVATSSQNSSKVMAEKARPGRRKSRKQAAYVRKPRKQAT